MKGLKNMNIFMEYANLQICEFAFFDFKISRLHDFMTVRINDFTI